MKKIKKIITLLSTLVLTTTCFSTTSISTSSSFYECYPQNDIKYGNNVISYDEETKLMLFKDGSGIHVVSIDDIAMFYELPDENIENVKEYLNIPEDLELFKYSPEDTSILKKYIHDISITNMFKNSKNTYYVLVNNDKELLNSLFETATTLCNENKIHNAYSLRKIYAGYAPKEDIDGNDLIMVPALGILLYQSTYVDFEKHLAECETKEPTEIPTTEETTSESTTLSIPTIIGEVNLDGEVALANAVTISKYLTNSTIYPFVDSTAIANADVNSDNIINNTDTLKLIEYFLKEISYEDLCSN